MQTLGDVVEGGGVTGRRWEMLLRGGGYMQTLGDVVEGGRGYMQTLGDVVEGRGIYADVGRCC